MVQILIKHRNLIDFKTRIITPDVKRKINTGNHKPIRIKTNFYSKKINDIIINEFQQLLKDGIVVRSDSVWSSALQQRQMLLLLEFVVITVK